MQKTADGLIKVASKFILKLILKSEEHNTKDSNTMEIIESWQKYCKEQANIAYEWASKDVRTSLPVNVTGR